ncbi:MAG: HPr family phosphocarrier protein, partial [Lachnospiraceae bacterium]|nr:HPr family phosphocarrier protein [Lachnospiraceae bacterium]
ACSVKIAKDGKEVDAKRIMGIMSLGVKCGMEITIKCDGEDEDKAAAELETFFKENL